MRAGTVDSLRCCPYPEQPAHSRGSTGTESWVDEPEFPNSGTHAVAERIYFWEPQLVRECSLGTVQTGQRTAPP